MKEKNCGVNRVIADVSHDLMCHFHFGMFFSVLKILILVIIVLSRIKCGLLVTYQKK